MALSSIKIFNKVYVGFQGRRTQDDVPLGFLTPYTEDAAGQKRRDTVDSWAAGRGYGREKTFNSVILENKPMIGFKIGRSIRRSGGWNGSGASYIRIEDPRGFELEITIENLVMCMKDNLVQNGEIITECVWGRDGNRNILLPTNSDPYKDSVKTTEKVNAKLSLRDIKAGDEIELLDGTRGIYYGGLFPIQYDRYGNDKVYQIEVGKKRYVLLHTNGRHKNKVMGTASLKVSSVTKAADAKLTPEEIEKAIEAHLKAHPGSCHDDTGYSYRTTTYFWTASDKPEVTNARLVEMQESDIAAKYQSMQANYKMVLAEQNGNYLDLTGRLEYNFVNRKASGRGYYKRNANSYSYYTSTSQVHTDGFIGYSSMVSSAQRITKYGSETHFEDDGTVKFYTIANEFTTKAGIKIDIQL